MRCWLDPLIVMLVSLDIPGHFLEGFFCPSSILLSYSGTISSLVFRSGLAWLQSGSFAVLIDIYCFGTPSRVQGVECSCTLFGFFLIFRTAFELSAFDFPVLWLKDEASWLFQIHKRPQQSFSYEYSVWWKNTPIMKNARILQLMLLNHKFYFKLQ